MIYMDIVAGKSEATITGDKMAGWWNKDWRGSYKFTLEKAPN